MNDKFGKYDPKATGLVNRKRVFAWFIDHKNACGRQGDCASDLGLSSGAVQRHVKAIRDGWRPDELLACKYCGIEGAPGGSA